MPQMSNLAAGRLSSLLRLVLIAAAPFVLAACANKEAQPDSAQLGPGGGAITPGTQRDFATNVGDIVYFSTDSTDLTPEAQQTLQKQAQWLRQYPQFTITIDGHSVRAVPRLCVASSRRTASTLRVSARSPTVRSAPLRYATTSRAGLRTGARRPC